MFNNIANEMYFDFYEFLFYVEWFDEKLTGKQMNENTVDLCLLDTISMYLYLVHFM